ncbi:hypothetical protein [Legionella hackeliae]|uniref:Uncharacterized protein n=1 Tax=Legionella hackeliae TaxID=449 RepID=A0A0A8UYI5_LEGHA|nr:hypothetical protein [Legionella hackeliae]KTD12745.1 hypothetical protein Lhac_1616 [Legionella hackeliae]CEK12167.1 protein of unknown function [Legionella hackeliae]STX48954.1 Uncharacterised protein [Legionella hackeliae]
MQVDIAPIKNKANIMNAAHTKLSRVTEGGKLVCLEVAGSFAVSLVLVASLSAIVV